MSAANIKTGQGRPERLRYVFEDQFAHLVWGAYLRLVRTSNAAVPPHTLTDRQARRCTPSLTGRHPAVHGVRGGRDTRGGAAAQPRTGCQSKGQDFTPLQLDVFHALWETYKERDCRPRLESAPSK